MLIQLLLLKDGGVGRGLCPATGPPWETKIIVQSPGPPRVSTRISLVGLGLRSNHDNIQLRTMI